MILQFHEDLQYLFPEQVNVEAATPLDALKLIAVQHPLSGKMEPVPVRIKELRELDLTMKRFIKIIKENVTNEN